MTLAVHESDALGNDDFARARFDDFARAGFDNDFARARFDDFARAGFNRAGGFFAGAGFNRAGGFHARAGNFSTARSFDPPPGLGRNFVNPNRIFVGTSRVHGVALAFCHFLEAGIVAVFTIVALAVHKRNASGSNDFARAGDRLHARAGDRLHARAGFNRLHAGAGFRFRRTGFRNFARAGFDRLHARAGFDRTGRYRFVTTRSFTPPPRLVRFFVNPLRDPFLDAILVHGIALASGHLS